MVSERVDVDQGLLNLINQVIEETQTDQKATLDNFLNKKATTKFKEESLMVSKRLSEIIRFPHKEKLWKPQKFNFGRFTALGKVLNSWMDSYPTKERTLF